MLVYPTLNIIDDVIIKGGIVTYNDPFIPHIKTHDGYDFYSVDITEKILYEADAVVITTNHSIYDKEFILKNSKLIVDLRNMFDKNDKVYKL